MPGTRDLCATGAAAPSSRFNADERHAMVLVFPPHPIPPQPLPPPSGLVHASGGPAKQLQDIKAVGHHFVWPNSSAAPCPAAHRRHREVNSHLLLEGQPRVVRAYHAFQGSMLVRLLDASAVGTLVGAAGCADALGLGTSKPDGLAPFAVPPGSEHHATPGDPFVHCKCQQGVLGEPLLPLLCLLLMLGLGLCECSRTASTQPRHRCRLSLCQASLRAMSQRRSPSPRGCR